MYQFDTGHRALVDAQDVRADRVFARRWSATQPGPLLLEVDIAGGETRLRGPIGGRRRVPLVAEIALRAGSTLCARTVSGNVTVWPDPAVAVPRLEEVDAVTTSGDVKVGVPVTRLHAQTTSGDIRARAVTSRLHATSTSGDVRVESVTGILCEVRTVKRGRGPHHRPPRRRAAGRPGVQRLR